MNIRHLLLMPLALLVSLSVSANCGDVPIPPFFLEQAQLQTDALDGHKVELETYLESVETYHSCIDEQIAQIAPADAPMEFYDSPEYQSQFDSFTALSETADSRMKLAVERYNYLLTITN